MSSVLTNKFRIHNAKSFVEGFSEAVPTNIYTAIGKVTPWSTNDTYSGASSTSSDSNPPTPLDHIQNENEVWRNMIAAKKVKNTDVVHAIPKVSWETNKIYTMYTDTDATLLVDVTNSSTPKPFYVMTDEFNVYKCLFNNNNSESTVKPTGNGTSLITPSDGYIWKYMYTVSPSDAFRFMTENFIPIQTLETNPGGGSSCSSPNLQWLVQTDAADNGEGRVDVIARRIGSSNNGAGSGYVSAAGTVISAAHSSGSTTITLNGTLGVGDDYYNNLTFYFSTLGTAFTITDFTQVSGGNDTLVVSGDATSGVSSGTAFQILPTVNITGDGTGLQAVAVMGSASNSSNADQIDSIKVLNGGSGYTKASVTFTNKAGVTTTDAVFDVIIPPQGGHGRDAVEELGGFFVMINTKLEYDEPSVVDKILTTDNDYRQISLIRQPKVSATGNADATADLYLQTQVITVSNVTNTFLPDEVVTQSSTNATGVVVDVLTDGNNKLIRIVNVSGTFNTTDTITSSGTASTSTISSITVPELLANSGDVMFVEQRSPIGRSQSQIEDIKIILEF